MNKEKILRNLDKISMEACGHLLNAELVKNYEETKWYFLKGIYGDDRNLKWKAWWDKVNKVEIEGEEIDLELLSAEDYWEIIQALINEVKQNPQDWKIEEKKHAHYTEKMIRHNSGRRHWKSLSNWNYWAEIEALVKGQPLPVGKIKDSEKSEILSWFISKNISKISLKNGKLAIEYSNNTEKIIEREDRMLQKFHQIIQNFPNKSLSRAELEVNESSENNNYNFYKGLAIGISCGIILVGIVYLFLLSRKRKSR